MMDDSKRATVYFDADVRQALRLKAAAADRSISDIVNEAVRWRWLKMLRTSPHLTSARLSEAFLSSPLSGP
jgi:hypothetical protein